jgi:hypothetical protein
MSKRILFALATVLLAIAGIFFRASSTHTARLQADEIVKSDTAGADTTAAITSLKGFVAAHMGGSVGFTLKASYDRAQAAAQAAAAATTSNSQIYADAQKACSGKSDSITQARCNQAYIAAHLSTAPTPAPVPAPQLATYQYALHAPWWTPDLSGALLLGAAAAAGLGLITRKQKGQRK